MPGCRLTVAMVLLAGAPPVWSDVAPDRFDAVLAAPGSHRVLLENAAVRVLRVSVAPGATEPVHDHCWPSVMYFERPQPITYVSYTLVEGSPVEASRVEVASADLSGAQETGPEGLHAIRNRGTEPFLALRVEFKDGRRAR